MGKLDKFIGELEGQGSISSRDETFTINFAAAWDKLSKFGLKNPLEAVLKLVQAANVAANEFCYEPNSNYHTVIFKGWEPTYSPERLKKSFTSENFRCGDHAFGYLSIALITLTKLTDRNVFVSQQIVGKKEVQTLSFDDSLSIKIETHSTPIKENTLVVSWQQTPEMETDSIKQILIDRCAFSTVPITFCKKPLEIPFPQTNGRARNECFSSNQLIAWRHYPGTHKLPNLKKEKLSPTYVHPDKEHRFASFQLTVDQLTNASIWFCKAGVMIEERPFNLGISGIIGVVSVEGVPTDLSGTKLVVNDQFKECRKWIKSACEELLNDALTSPNELHPTSNITVAKRDAFFTALTIFLVLEAAFASLTFYLKNNYFTNEDIALAIFFMGTLLLGGAGYFLWKKVAKRLSRDEDQVNIDKVFTRLKNQSQRLERFKNSASI